MSNIPDFVLHIEEVERNLNASWNMVRMDTEGDCVIDAFEKGVYEPYSGYFRRYITGESLYGLGVAELMTKMDEHLEQMSDLTGRSPDVAFSCAAGPQYGLAVSAGEKDMIDVEDINLVQDRGGVVHDERRDRDYWDPEKDGVKPGELQGQDIKNILNEKRGW